MRDPYIHVEKHVAGLTHAAMRELISDTIGLAPSAPKTVGTGCGKRRPYAMTSTDPVKVTCLACRDYAAAQHDWYAEGSEFAAELQTADPTPGYNADVMLANARRHRDIAERFRAK